MSLRIKVIAAGAVFLVIGLFLYFTLRFTNVENERLGSLVRTTNSIVGEYRDLEKRLAAENRVPAPGDLSGFLESAHRKYRQVALMAVTDRTLSVRLSSKNDRYIHTVDLFEAILKDFTQDKFNITKDNPYVVRYYDEKTARGVEQLRFYVFLTRIGGYRLLVVYPHAVGGTVITRSVLEVSLLVLLIVIITAAAYIMASKKPTQQGSDEGRIIDLSLQGGPPSSGDTALPNETASVVSDGLSGYIHDLFKAINASCDTDAVSLYIFHYSGKLVKTMELTGSTFLRIDSVSFDTIDVDNEAGRELRGGASMVLEEGRTIIIPLVYNEAFLGVVKMTRRDGLQGSQMRDARSAVTGVLKNIHDYIMVNDVMTDAGTGLHSKIYCNLKYNECLKAWSGKGKDFSILYILLCDAFERLGDAEKNGIIKLIGPAAADIIGNDGYLCRHDNYLALIMPDVNARKAKAVERRLKSSLDTFRIKITDDTVVKIDARIGLASSDTASPGEDPAALAMRQVTGSTGP
ncbi:MAG: diguanylate cyclase [Spirochaetes bacterium]|nr:diguanylate cyclase [Spirochaetota bacterium]